MRHGRFARILAQVPTWAQGIIQIGLAASLLLTECC